MKLWNKRKSLESGPEMSPVSDAASLDVDESVKAESEEHDQRWSKLTHDPEMAGEFVTALHEKSRTEHVLAFDDLRRAGLDKTRH